MFLTHLFGGMAKTLLTVFLTFTFVFSVHAAESAKPYTTDNLLGEIGKAAGELEDADQGVINGLGSKMLSEVYRSVVAPAYTALMAGRSKNFLQALTPKLAEAYDDSEAQEALRKEYSKDSVEGYSDKAKIAAVRIGAEADGSPDAIIEYHYLMAKSETDIIDFVVKVSVPFVAGTKVEGGNLNALLTTLAGLDIDKAKIAQWKKVPIKAGESNVEDKKAENATTKKEEVKSLLQEKSVKMREPADSETDKEIFNMKKQREKSEMFRLIREGKYI